MNGPEDILAYADREDVVMIHIEAKSLSRFHLSGNIHFFLNGLHAEILMFQVISMNSYYGGHILHISYVYFLKMLAELKLAFISGYGIKQSCCPIAIDGFVFPW